MWNLVEEKEQKKPESKKQILWQLFIQTLYLSAFTFGGGDGIVTLMKQKFVDELGWIDEEEMLDLVAIAQSAPGAIAVNGALVVGYKLAGVPGIIVAVVGTLIPPLIIISLISIFYTAFRQNQWIALALEGMQAGVGAVIAAVVYDMGSGVVETRDTTLNIIMVVVFILNCFLEVNVLYIILAAIAIGLLRYYLKGREQ